MARPSSQSQQIYNYPIRPVFEALKYILSQHFGNMSLVSADTETWTVIARTGITPTSWGEQIIIKVEELDPNRSLVNFVSRSNFSILDFGRNGRLVSRISEALTQRLEQKI